MNDKLQSMCVWSSIVCENTKIMVKVQKAYGNMTEADDTQAE